MSFRVVPMEARHLDALALLEQDCFKEPWSRESLQSELKSLTAFFLVALESEGRVAGYVGSQRVFGEWYVSNVAVFKEYRRQGVARLLMQSLLADAEAEHGLFLSLEVRPSNTPALALYTGLGFEQAGMRKNFYKDPQEDGLILTKKLPVYIPPVDPIPPERRLFR